MFDFMLYVFPDSTLPFGTGRGTLAYDWFKDKKKSKIKTDLHNAFLSYGITELSQQFSQMLAAAHYNTQGIF